MMKIKSSYEAEEFLCLRQVRAGKVPDKHLLSQVGACQMNTIAFKKTIAFKFIPFIDNINSGMKTLTRPCQLP